MYSPWGFIQSKITLSPYVYCVDTPSHGGIMVAIKTAEDILTADASSTVSTTALKRTAMRL